jgi:hypothetical protein
MLKWIREQQVVIIIICLIIIGVCLPVILYANANLPELVERNVRDSVLLVVEMEEHGDDFIGAKQDHAFILRKYLGRMKERNFSLLLRALYPALSPRKQLAAALKDLNMNGSATSDQVNKRKQQAVALAGLSLEEGAMKRDQAKKGEQLTEVSADLSPEEEREQERAQAEKEIKKARDTIKQFVIRSQEFSGLEIAIFEHEELPEGLLEAAKLALESAKESVEKFMLDPNVANAQEACRKNRIAISLAYLVRCAYQHFNSLDEELRQFRGDIDRTIYYNDLLMKNNADLLANAPLRDVRKQLEEDNGLLKKYTESELRRLDIVDAILDKDNRKAESLLRNTIIVSS